MIGKLGSLAAMALVIGLAAPTMAQERTLDQVLANCDRATGLPPGATPPPRSEPGQKVVINPDWLRKIDPRGIRFVYPENAWNERIGGRAVIRCQVSVDGLAQDCAIVNEAPPGFGFGEAALKLAPAMRFVPKRVDCEPVGGATVTVPIDFRRR
jgi:TonB family protein